MKRFAIVSSKTSAWRKQVKGLRLPIRTTLVRGLVTCRMYASLGQLMRGWSRILYDALDRKPWRLLLRLLDPLVFCQSGQVALLAAIIMLIGGFAGPFPIWLLGLSIRSPRFDVSGLPAGLPLLRSRLEVRRLVSPGESSHRRRSGPSAQDVSHGTRDLAWNQLRCRDLVHSPSVPNG